MHNFLCLDPVNIDGDCQEENPSQHSSLQLALQGVRIQDHQAIHSTPLNFLQLPFRI